MTLRWVVPELVGGHDYEFHVGANSVSIESKDVIRSHHLLVTVDLS